MAINEKQLTPDIGLSEESRDGVVDILNTVLADEHVLYIKLRNYHWNVTGPHFHELHETFEEQYTAVAVFIDDTAERVRQYGSVAPGTMAAFIEKSRLSEHSGEVPDASVMVTNIVDDHEDIIRNLRGDIETVGDKLGDVGAEDFLIGLLQEHQEQAWMLRAMLHGDAL